MLKDYTKTPTPKLIRLYGNAMRAAVGGSGFDAGSAPQADKQAKAMALANEIRRRGLELPKVCVCSRFIPAPGESVPAQYGY